MSYIFILVIIYGTNFCGGSRIFLKAGIDGLGGGGLFPGMRRALLYHVGVAGFAAFIFAAAVAGTTRV